MKKPIDILFGNCTLREALDRDAIKTPGDLDELVRLDAVVWRKQIVDHLLYQ